MTKRDYRQQTICFGSSSFPSLFDAPRRTEITSVNRAIMNRELDEDDAERRPTKSVQSVIRHSDNKLILDR
jgi:hypothetical protein